MSSLTMTSFEVAASKMDTTAVERPEANYLLLGKTHTDLNVASGCSSELSEIDTGWSFALISLSIDVFVEYHQINPQMTDDNIMTRSVSSNGKMTTLS
jgi:hypothetical protein